MSHGLSQRPAVRRLLAFRRQWMFRQYESRIRSAAMQPWSAVRRTREILGCSDTMARRILREQGLWVPIPEREPRPPDDPDARAPGIVRVRPRPVATETRWRCAICLAVTTGADTCPNGHAR